MLSATLSVSVIGLLCLGCSRRALTTGPIKQKQRILLVEDHDDSRIALARLLHRFGFEVVQSATVADAKLKLEGNACALLDFNLPDGVGSDILLCIRSQRYTTRVAFITALHSPQSLLFGNLKVEAVFRKPLNFSPTSSLSELKQAFR
jgi:DNA-binding response OmpR family regulator